MTINNFEIDKDLRKRFKIICASNEISMKEAMIKEVSLILEEDRPVSRVPTGAKDTIGHFMVNIDNDTKQQMIDYCEDNGCFIRDLVMTAIINVVESNSDYNARFEGLIV